PATEREPVVSSRGCTVQAGQAR
ncbi:MAG: hypothetical protein QOG75_2962, partial [Mycobacterium sp.]|nr:hypothetical protein [Mycobacterium sp.]